MSKAAFVYNNDGVGGAQKIITWVAKKYTEIFDEVYFISLQNANTGISIPDGVNHINLVFSDEAKKHGKIGLRMLYIRRLKSCLQQIKPEIVCAFGASSVLYACLIKKSVGCKVIGSERGSSRSMSFFWKTVSKKCYPRCDAMVFQTEGAKEYFGSSVEKNSFIIPNPYLGEASDGFVCFEKRKKEIVCAAARFSEEKGFDTAILAFSHFRASHPDYKLVIYAGARESDAYKKCTELIREKRLEECVEINQPVKNIALHCRDCAVFVLPSRTEGIPNTLLEFLGQGVPTVSCDCPPGGPRMLTDGGSSGLVVPVDDDKKMSEALAKIVDDPAFADRLSIRALDVHERFNEEKIAEQWKKILEKINEK